MQRTTIEAQPLTNWSRARGVSISSAVRLGDLVFVAGFPPFSGDGAIVQLGIERQAEIILEQMKTVLAAAGSSLEKVAKVNVYADDAKHFETFNRVYARFFPVDPPARIFLVTAGWPGPFNLEVDCVACV